MPIVADPSEERFTSVVQQAGIEVAYIPNLEALTGADWMVTPLDLPVAPRFLDKHIEAGAFLIQRKTGLDLASSVGDRMAESLHRMLATGARQGQCVLLFVGQLLVDREGYAVIDGHTVSSFGHQTYWVIQSSIDKWTECGGVFVQLPRPALLPGWLSIKHAHAKENRGKARVVYEITQPLFEVKPNDPLQELVRIKDWRRTLMSFPNVGAKRIQSLYAYMQSNGIEMSLVQALLLITNEKTPVPGFGKALVKELREWLGLKDQDLSLKETDDEQSTV